VTLGLVLQARMGSTRLPGKVLKPIAGRTLLEHVFERAAAVRRPCKLVVATSTLRQDDAVEALCRKAGVGCFRGDESDVLARYLGCAESLGLDPVVRLTGDNPFTDVEELERLIDLRSGSGCDFAHSFKGLPIGVGAEIFTLAALRASAKEGLEPHHREHVDEFLLEHPERFRTLELETPSDKRRPAVRLTVDTDEDYRRACYVAERAAGRLATTLEAIRLAEDYDRALR